MAKFYDVEVSFADGSKTLGRGVGNNAAWICPCGNPMLGPHEGLYSVEPCPTEGCGRSYRIVRGCKPNFVAHVEERDSRRRRSP